MMPIVLCLVLLFSAFYSAVLLVLASFARSFKEAQAYVVPLMLVSLVPGLLALVPDVESPAFEISQILERKNCLGAKWSQLRPWEFFAGRCL